MSPQYRLILITLLAAIFVIGDSPVVTAVAQPTSVTHNTIAGYSALKLFLEDEQHLTTIRRVKMVINFAGISEQSKKLVDDIANSSEQAVDELEKLSTVRPAFKFKTFPDETIAKATIDSLRMTTAKEFLLDGDNFEKDMLISQLKILRLISHLARQLEENETNNKRKVWLAKLSDRYEDYYQQAYAGLLIPAQSPDNKLARLK